MTVFRFCWKRMVLGAQLMTKTTNKSTTYFQGVTVIVNIILSNADRNDMNKRSRIAMDKNEYLYKSV